MRQILGDYARQGRASKRDGGCRIEFEELAASPVTGDTELLTLDDALHELARVDERRRKVNPAIHSLAMASRNTDAMLVSAWK